MIWRNIFTVAIGSEVVKMYLNAGTFEFYQSHPKIFLREHIWLRVETTSTAAHTTTVSIGGATANIAWGSGSILRADIEITSAARAYLLTGGNITLAHDGHTYNVACLSSYDGRYWNGRNDVREIQTIPYASWTPVWNVPCYRENYECYDAAGTLVDTVGGVGAISTVDMKDVFDLAGDGLIEVREEIDETAKPFLYFTQTTECGLIALDWLGRNGLRKTYLFEVVSENEKADDVILLQTQGNDYYARKGYVTSLALVCRHATPAVQYYISDLFVSGDVVLYDGSSSIGQKIYVTADGIEVGRTTKDLTFEVNTAQYDCN